MDILAYKDLMENGPKRHQAIMFLASTTSYLRPLLRLSLSIFLQRPISSKLMP